MSEPNKTRYPMSSIAAAMGNFVNIRQRDGEQVDQYNARLKEAKDNLRTKMGDNFLSHFMQTTDEYKQADKEEKENILHGSLDALHAFLVIASSDQKKYGSITTNLAQQYALGNDQYPRIPKVAAEILSNHKYDRKDPPKQRDQKNRDDSETTTVESSFAQKAKSNVPFFCYCCGKPDHGSNKCNHKGKPKSEWYINKVAQHHHQTVLAPQAKDSKGDSNKDTSKEDNKSVSFSDPFTYQGCTLSHTQMENNHSGTIALDTGSMIDVFGNPDLVNNIHQVSKGLLMQTNSGTSKINTQADVPGLGKVWFKKGIPTNIVGMANLVDHPSTAYITYDSREADQFNIHHHSGNVTVFKRTKDKLYTHTPKQLTKGSYMTTVSMDLSSGTLMNTTPLNLWVSTVNENKKNFTEKQFQQAVRARKLYHIVGAPTADNFKYMLKAGAIINCPVKSSHVDLAKRIFGEDIATLKGKSTRNRSPAVTVDQIEVPKELIAKNQDLELHIDVMYVNQEAFLTSIDMPVRFRTANYMDKVNKDHFYTALDRVLRKYNAAGFYVRHIHADSEFQPIMDEVKDGLDVTVHVAAPEQTRASR